MLFKHLIFGCCRDFIVFHNPFSHAISFVARLFLTLISLEELPNDGISCSYSVERLAGLSDGQTMLCVAGDINAHIGVVEQGDEESIGRFGWGTRNREGRELVDMLRRNGLAVAGTFFQKKESHKITYRIGRHKTELDLLVVRQQQLRRVKDSNALAGEYVTTQHEPVIFEVRMKKWKRTMGPKNIKWWKGNDAIMVECRERVRRKYEER